MTTNNPPATRGALYVVSGDRKYLEEAVFSAKTLRQCHPKLPIAFASPSKNFKPACADFFISLPPQDHPLKYKPLALANSPFTETLFLDSDTQVKGTLDELFDLFGHAELAAAHDLLADWAAVPPRFVSYRDPDHYNTGVLLVRKTPACLALMNEWFERTRAQKADDMRPGHLCDQHWFNTLVVQEKRAERLGVSMASFDNRRYNVRPQMVEPLRAEGLLDAARILHFRGGAKPSLKRRLSALLSKIGLRR